MRAEKNNPRATVRSYLCRASSTEGVSRGVVEGGMRRGALRAGIADRHSGGGGALPPGPPRVPARSWLTTCSGERSSTTSGESGARSPLNRRQIACADAVAVSAHVARREASARPEMDANHTGLAPFGAPPLPCLAHAVRREGLTRAHMLLPPLSLRIMFRGRVEPRHGKVIDASDARRDGIWCWHGLPGRDLPRAHFLVRTPP